MQAYLSLGGNEGNVLLRLQRAFSLLSDTQAISGLKVSHFYRTAPLQVNSANWFVNAACSFRTELQPRDLFLLTQSVETQLGKVIKPKNADRPIDIDLLFYGDQIYQDKDLEIPHPRWKERLFVLIPLRDLTKKIILNGNAGEERYFLPDLIRPLLLQPLQAVSLLEKNPNLH